jgi:hypothetical protein
MIAEYVVLLALIVLGEICGATKTAILERNNTRTIFESERTKK